MHRPSFLAYDDNINHDTALNMVKYNPTYTMLLVLQGGVTDACAVCKILHVIECAWGSSGFKLPTV